MRAPHTGRVATFDEARGLGTVDDAGPGGASFPFHCTAIADGTRRIEVGQRVSFVVVAGHRGVLEATGLVKVDPGSPQR